MALRILSAFLIMRRCIPRLHLRSSAGLKRLLPGRLTDYWGIFRQPTAMKSALISISTTSFLKEDFKAPLSSVYLTFPRLLTATGIILRSLGMAQLGR